MYPLQYKLIIPHHFDMATLQKEVEKGGKFITYSYNISLLGLMLNRLSPAIFIPAGKTDVHYRKKFNALCYVFGWWSLPGIPKTISNIRFNNSGGLDITDDIMLNIKEESFPQQTVSIVYTNMSYDQLNKEDLKAFKKVLQNTSGEYYIESCIAGLCINTADSERRTFAVGIKLNGSIEEHLPAIKKDLYRQFFKYVVFRFIDLSQHSEEAVLLNRQGTRIF